MFTCQVAQCRDSMGGCVNDMCSSARLCGKEERHVFDRLMRPDLGRVVL